MAALKVTLTLPSEVLAAVDRFAASHSGATRSGVCAAALRDWLRAQQDSEIEAYYLSLSEEERAEDAAWSSVAAERADPRWQ